MTPTKHATTNFRMIRPFLDEADRSPEGYRRFTADGYMPLSVESLGYIAHGGHVYSMTHYGEQNGDLMADPDMMIAVNFERGTVEPLTYQNDYLGKYEEVYLDDGRYSPSLRTDLDAFLWFWIKNIHAQGFDPHVYEHTDEDEITEE